MIGLILFPALLAVWCVYFVALMRFASQDLSFFGDLVGMWALLSMIIGAPVSAAFLAAWLYGGAL